MERNVVLNQQQLDSALKAGVQFVRVEYMGTDYAGPGQSTSMYKCTSHIHQWEYVGYTATTWLPDQAMYQLFRCECGLNCDGRRFER